jgi:leucyl-tRNA synthetase
VPGVHRFLGRVWRLAVPEDFAQGSVHAHLQADRQDDPALEKALHRCIAKVEGDIDRMAFNTAIAAMMIFVNEATKRVDAMSRGQMLRFAQILSPFAPHLAEEIWSRLHGASSLAYAPWPSFDPKMLVDDEVEIAVQILGKVRGRAVVAMDADHATMVAAAKAAVGSQLEGKTIVKEIVVPKKLVNFVVK